MTMPLTPSPVSARCRNGHVIRTTSDHLRAGWVNCPCGSHGVARFLTVTETETPCDARCTGARGLECNCSCVGANHGADLTFVSLS